jgi:SAM-dependent methyltransferase
VSDERWLEWVWPFVRGQLPTSPARVLEVGCGELGGFVPMLRREGHAALGVDPQAPEGPDYRQAALEEVELPGAFDVVVACTSLHHVSDLGDAVGRIAAALEPTGSVVVVEWAWERFDEATARWCFDRVAADLDHSWLRHHKDEWQATGQSWAAYMDAWATAEGMHTNEEIRRELDRHFTCQWDTTAPYFFPDLDGTIEADEQAAIDAGTIRATGTRYVGRAAHKG